MLRLCVEVFYNTSWIILTEFNPGLLFMWNVPLTYGDWIEIIYTDVEHKIDEEMLNYFNNFSKKRKSITFMLSLYIIYE